MPAVDAIAALNQRLANRGLPPVRFAAAIDAGSLPPVTVACAQMPWRQAIEAVAAALGLGCDGQRLDRR